MCKICGADAEGKTVRFWSPDDGWVAGRLCDSCRAEAIKRRPQKDDFAWDKRGELFGDEDEAISEIFG